MDRLRVMTFNIQGLFNPLEQLSGDLTQKSEAKRRVKEVVAAIKALPQDQLPDVICLDEVLFREVFEIVDEGLKDLYPSRSWSAFSDPGEAMVIAGVGGAIAGGLVGLLPGGVALGLLAGWVWDQIFTDSGGNSGVMILARTPFQKFSLEERSETPRLRLFDQTDETTGNQFSIAVGEYSDSSGADNLARKGFALIKLLASDGGPLYVLATHLQAAYPDGCGPDHYNEGSCKQYAEVRRSQINEIVVALRKSGLEDNAWRRTIIAGDLNIRGEPDPHTYISGKLTVTPEGPTIEPGSTEWTAIFEAPDDVPPGNTFKRHHDAWHRHTALPEFLVDLAHGIDPGITNFDLMSDNTAEDEEVDIRPQRLDYVVLPKARDDIDPGVQLFLEPQLMRNRFKGLSDHRSLEVIYGPPAPWCMPSTADIASLTLSQDDDGCEVVLLNRPIQRWHATQPYEWTMLPIEPNTGRAYQRGKDAGFTDDYSTRVGVVPGSYGIAVSELTEAGSGATARRLDFALVLADNLSASLTPDRIREETETVMMTSGDGRERLKVSGIEEKVFPITGPVYIRRNIVGWIPAVISIRLLNGATRDTAISLVAWDWNTPAWPDPWPQGGEVECWFLIRPRRHSTGHSYGCRVVIENPNKIKFEAEVLTEASSGDEAFLNAQGQPLVAVGEDLELELAWDTPVAGGGFYLRLRWDRAKSAAGTRVRFEPQLTGFGNGKATETQLLFACLKETSGIGSDEILVRLYTDDTLWLTLDWPDADSGEKLASVVYQALLINPAWFNHHLRITVTETGDVTGRERGAVTLKCLSAEGSESVKKTIKVDDGDGVYHVEGTLFRNQPDRTED